MEKVKKATYEEDEINQFTREVIATDLSRQKKKSANLKIGQRKLSSLWNRKTKIKEKWTEHKASAGHDQGGQHAHCGNPRRRERGRHNIWRNRAQNFPNLVKDININIQEAQWTPPMMNSKRPTARHIIIQLFKDKKRNLKQWERSILSHMRASTRLSDFPSETLEGRMQCADISKC